MVLVVAKARYACLMAWRTDLEDMAAMSYYGSSGVQIYLYTTKGPMMYRHACGLNQRQLVIMQYCLSGA